MSDYDAQYESTPHLFGPDASRLLADHGHRIAPGGRVLDIGVGQGRNALPLARRGLHVTGIDASKVAIESTRAAAQREGLVLDLWCGSVFDYEATHEAFDAILVFGLLQILSRSQIADLIARIERWLAPDGLVFVTAWQVDDPRYETVQSSCERIGAHSYRRDDGEIRTYLGRGEILELFAGWSVEHHWEGLGPEHRHGDAPPERHGEVEFVGRKPTR